MNRHPETIEAFLGEVEHANGTDHRFDDHLRGLKKNLADHGTRESSARWLVEDMALALQGSLLLQHAPPALADAFCVSRLGPRRSLQYGTLADSADLGAIITRHTVADA